MIKIIIIFKKHKFSFLPYVGRRNKALGYSTKKRIPFGRGKGHLPIAVERSRSYLVPFLQENQKIFLFLTLASFLRQWISSIWIKLRWSLDFLPYNHVKGQINASSTPRFGRNSFHSYHLSRRLFVDRWN